MKIALVHEFLNQLGGAERVLLNFLEIWPDAEIHVILYSAENTDRQFEKYKKQISFLDKFPGVHSHPRLFLPLMAKAIESFDFSDYDLVLSDSSSFAKGAKAKGKLHICYCHTPTRFLWTDPDYLSRQPYPVLFRWLGKFFLPKLKRWDLAAAQRPTFFIANSVNVQNRIKTFYGRDSVVIPPPVDTQFFRQTSSKQDYFFTASRLEPYKKIEVVIAAFNELRWRLKIAGTGTIIDKLQVMAKSNIEFLGRVSDEDLRQYYSESRAFIFPTVEDAGIMILEAAACGTPVIAYRAGGALETIIQGTTGEFFNEQTPQSLITALRNFYPAQYQSQTIRQHALRFDKKNFQQKIKAYVEEKYADRD
ncbi:MAG: hypothetical protein A2660_00680 [Candidatus Doudnabacteria bacterium RIFCSPHIGHO2_01_FULL_45_18]|uniref:Uncharacterized protein n=1 Tax=Candidatus Doudnabacteria bacterium RIFCSPHIGHO2_01_FULL_45_18 TaxID=1817823 RepID=A0A1F5NQ14_9BACT|nr:MAG: hypothetical protein A2660_00680 [Candidatus Doudnabacteria bacterium RIFCSPHIGHO2_01_FULL_45_18]